jgi:hypothetical protein
MDDKQLHHQRLLAQHQWAQAARHIFITFRWSPCSGPPSPQSSYSFDAGRLAIRPPSALVTTFTILTTLFYPQPTSSKLLAV